MENKKEEAKSEHHSHHGQHHNKEKKPLPMDAEFFITLFLVILAGVFVINLFLGFNVAKEAEKQISAAKEAARPAVLQLISIENNECGDCTDAKDIASLVKGGSTNITKEEAYDINDDEAKLLVKQYSITKVPTLIIKGEIEKYSNSNFEKRNDALVFLNPLPPYFDTGKNKVVGRLGITYLVDKACKECEDVTVLGKQLKPQQVAIKSEKTVAYDSSEGQELIKKYDIVKIPTVIMTDDAGAYKIITAIWDKIGSIESDGMYVMRDISPPYRDLKENAIKGLVEMIMIDDKSCAVCYNVSIHKQILANFGVELGSAKVLDASSSDAKALIAKYKITNVPTVVLSKDIDIYTSLKQVWSQVGSVESDGRYVFRKMEQLGAGTTYRDLEKNEIITNKAS